MQEFLYGSLIFISYIIPLGIIMILVRKFCKIQDELFRKALHFILLGAYIPLLYGFKTWWICIIMIACLLLILFPILIIASKLPLLKSYIIERKKGEFLSSMVLSISIMIISITIGWGIFDDKLIVLACVYSWGVGDAFAALIGKKYGKHKITLKFVDNKKSIEGSLAMVITSTIAVLCVLLIRGGIHPLYCIVISLLSAIISTFVELCTKNGLDTITCPLASMAVILPLITLLGG